MSPDSWIGVAATVVTGGFAAWGARSARRTKRQEKRDDFTTVTDRMDKEIKRLETRQSEQQEQITGQGAAISWLVVDRRSLVHTIRTGGLKVPVPRPIPDRARPYLDSVDV
jgi:hypothetical protein